MRWALGTGLVTALVLVAAMYIGGDPPGDVPAGLPDPGLVTGWGLPTAKILADLAGIVTVGLLLTGAFLLPGDGDEIRGLAARAVHGARWAAGLWALALVVLFMFTVSDTFARPVPELGSSVLAGFVVNVDLGRALAAQLILALVIAVVAGWTTSVRTAAILTGLSVAGFVPQALTGHAAGAGSHLLAIWTMVGHLSGVSLWVGGLVGLGWIALRSSRRLPAGAHRFSTLAAWCLVIVAASGVINALLRIDTAADLMSGYGQLLIGKASALVALGCIGLWHRRTTIPALQSSIDASDDSRIGVVAGRGFARLAAAELTIMAAAAALAVALSRSPTPVPDDRYEGRAAELLGRPLPDAPSLWRIVTTWTTDGLGLLIVSIGVALYIKGVLVVRQQGRHWPFARTVSWLAGMALLGWATFGGLGRYSGVVFSAHMAAVAVLAVIAPILLAYAGPVQLAGRALPGPRTPGDVSPRDIFDGWIKSRPVRVLTSPPVAAAIWLAVLYSLYLTGLFTYFMLHQPGRSLITLLLFGSGVLLFGSVTGRACDNITHAWRVASLGVAAFGHAVFAVLIMSVSWVIGRPYWTFLDRGYVENMHGDQLVGGALVAALGLVPMMTVFAVLLRHWNQARETDAMVDR